MAEASGRVGGRWRRRATRRQCARTPLLFASLSVFFFWRRSPQRTSVDERAAVSGKGERSPQRAMTTAAAAVFFPCPYQVDAHFSCRLVLCGKKRGALLAAAYVTIKRRQKNIRAARNERGVKSSLP